MAKPIRLVGPRLVLLEARLAQAELEGETDKTLFVQLTALELSQVQLGLYLVALLYGAEAVVDLAEKLDDLIDHQEFCDCPECKAEREEEKDGA